MGLEAMEREEEIRQKREKRIEWAAILWPTRSKKDQYFQESGRDAGEEMHSHLAHCLNRSEFRETWDEYLALPDDQVADKLLIELRTVAIQVSLTKDRKRRLKTIR